MILLYVLLILQISNSKTSWSVSPTKNKHVQYFFFSAESAHDMIAILGKISQKQQQQQTDRRNSDPLYPQLDLYMLAIQG